MVSLTIAVTTYKGAELLPACLQSLIPELEDFPESYEVLVIDGEPVTMPLPLPLRGRKLHAPPQGNINAMNVAFREAQGEWVLFVADDVRLHPGCLEALWTCRTSVTQPILYDTTGAVDNAGLSWRWPGYGARRQTWWAGGILQPVPAFAATCFLMRRTVWEHVGPFDEALGISHEDIDYSLRLRQAGQGAFVNTLAEATHLMGQTIGRTTEGALSPYYHRARLRVVAKHYRGLPRLLRLGAIQLLDSVAAHRPRR